MKLDVPAATEAVQGWIGDAYKPRTFDEAVLLATIRNVHRWRDAGVVEPLARTPRRCAGAETGPVCKVKSLREICVEHAIAVQERGGRPDHLVISTERAEWLVAKGLLVKKADGTYGDPAPMPPFDWANYEGMPK